MFSIFKKKTDYSADLSMSYPGLLIQLPANVCVRQQIMDHVLEFLTPTWETLMEFLASGFGLT